MVEYIGQRKQAAVESRGLQLFGEDINMNGGFLYASMENPERGEDLHHDNRRVDEYEHSREQTGIPCEIYSSLIKSLFGVVMAYRGLSVSVWKHVWFHLT